MKYIASCSFGKDSIATILLALEHNEPLDAAVWSEVMFSHADNISGEEILETYESYFTPVYKEYYWDVMGVGKPKVKGDEQ